MSFKISLNQPLLQISWKPEDLQDSYQLWVSTTSAERQLYSAITQRVQEALLKLEKEAKAAES